MLKNTLGICNGPKQLLSSERWDVEQLDEGEHKHDESSAKETRLR